MLFHAVKKDFLLVKRYIPILLAVCIFFPLFLVRQIPQYAGVLGFVLVTVCSIFMLLQNVSLKETQYPKASALLCALPYSRGVLVVSKYIFCMMIFLACCLIYGAETLVLPRLGAFWPEVPIITFFVISMFLAIYLPVQFKFGYEKTKSFFFIIIMATPFVFPQLVKVSAGIDMSFLTAINPAALFGGMIGLGGLLYVASAVISVRIYKNADLA